MKPLILTVASLGFVLSLAACAHHAGTAPNSPRATKAQPAPTPPPNIKAQAPEPGQPRQYQGPPPHMSKPQPAPQPTLVLVGQPGWQVVDTQAYSLAIQHTKAKGAIIFRVMPTQLVGSPDEMCKALRQAGRKNQFLPDQMLVTRDKLGCSFNWRQTTKNKGAKIRHWRGKVSVDRSKDVPALTVLMIGQWPANSHKLMLKHFNNFRRTTKIVMAVPDRTVPEKKIDRLR